MAFHLPGLFDYGIFQIVFEVFYDLGYGDLFFIHAFFISPLDYVKEKLLIIF